MTYGWGWFYPFKIMVRIIRNNSQRNSGMRDSENNCFSERGDGGWNSGHEPQWNLL